MKRKKCAYCDRIATDKEHVFPKCLYPKSKNNSKVQRLTVPACNVCNNSWSDDEAHFRNILLLAGEPNSVVYELWETAERSLEKVDGKKRLNDIILQMKPMKVNNVDRFKVFPGNDEKVIRILKKIVRGLCYKHYDTTVSEKRIWVDILKFIIPEQFIDELKYSHREFDIVEYRYNMLNENDIHSVWFITFFERCTFIGIVFQ